MGTLPPQLGDLAGLRSLDLSSNRLSGAIPKELGRLVRLASLDLSDNELNGVIPPEVGGLGALSNLWLSRNRLTGTIPKELGNLGTLFWTLNLEGNRLSGPVPPELMQLVSLAAVDLRWNALYTSDSALRAFLSPRQHSGPWESTQTVAPTGLAARTSGDRSVPLAWNRILYAADGGGYRFLVGTTPGGPYTLTVTTTSKSALSATATGLSPDTTYYFVVESVTDPHSGNPNTVVSEPSLEVSARTQALPVQGLTIMKTGTGAGTVVSSPPAIDCGPGCATAVATGTALVLTATPDPGSRFESWAGACSGSAGTCPLTMDKAEVVAAAFYQPALYHTVTPCRLFDSRDTPGYYLGGDTVTTLAVAGLCGIPGTARAAALNVTVITPGPPGHLRIFPAGDPLPPTSVINYSPVNVLYIPRANNATISLGVAGAVDVYVGCAVNVCGPVVVIMDVSGYFE
jgi:hypothetical protein